MEKICWDAGWLVANSVRKRIGKDARDLGEGKRFRSGKRVRPAAVCRWVGERVDRDFGDIAQINKRDSTCASRDEDAVVAPDVVTIRVAEILGEEPRSEDGPSLRSRPKVLFDGVVWHERVVSRTGNRNEHHLGYTVRSGDIQEYIESPLGIRDGGRTQQEHGIAACDGGTARARIEEVEAHGVDPHT